MLPIYLNDHLAGSTLGRDLSRRAAANNQGTSYGPFLDELAQEIDEDRDTLIRLMKGRGVTINHFKAAAAWTGEKLGRLKLNGRLRGYSPLSRVVEIELLALGVHGKLALWRALERLGSPDPVPGVDLTELIRRAEKQREGLEEHRLKAVEEAFS
jgi:hypothetical protein